MLSRVMPALHPILWVDEGADLDDENANLAKGMLVAPSMALEVGVGKSANKYTGFWFYGLRIYGLFGFILVIWSMVNQYSIQLKGED